MTKNKDIDGDTKYGDGWSQNKVWPREQINKRLIKWKPISCLNQWVLGPVAHERFNANIETRSILNSHLQEQTTF